MYSFRRWLTVAGGVLFIFLVGSSIVFFRQSAGYPSIDNPPVANRYSLSLPSPTPLPTLVSAPLVKNTIVADEVQTPSTLHFTVVSIESAGYLVIRENIHDTPGSVIGVSSLLSAGIHTSLTIPTLRPISLGQSFAASLHRDNGDMKFTDIKTDPMLFKDDGSLALITFTYEEDE